MDRKAHWEKVYATKSHTEVSWFTEHIQSSLQLISQTGLDTASAVIDVGGGASTLVDDLLARGFKDLTVMDISGAALEIARGRLGERAAGIKWIEADILESDFDKRMFDLWHD